MRTTLFSSTQGDIVTQMAFFNNQGAITDPGVSNDITERYEVGSQWINTAGGIVWTCVDNTEGAAVWVVSSSDETTPGQVIAPDASTPTGVGGAAKLQGGDGGTTSGTGGASTVQGGAGTAGNAAGGAGAVIGGAGQGTGAGGAATVTGGASGAGATGNGGPASLLGGTAASTNGNGGDVLLDPGAKAGTGKDGVILHRGLDIVAQGAPAAKTVSGLLTAADLLTGIITVNQGGGAASAQQLPDVATLDTALPTSAAGDAFDFSVINISTVGAEDASLTTNTGWTLVGNIDIASNAAATDKSAGRFRARKTGAGAWTLYRLS